MDYWLTGTGLEHVSAALVADDQRGSDERRTHRHTLRRIGQARRAIAGVLVALAARLDPSVILARPASTPRAQTHPA